MVPAFQNTEIVTLFGPSSEARSRFPPDLNNALSQDLDYGRAVISHHVVPGVWPKSRLTDGLQLTTLANETLTISVENDVYKVNGATIEAFDYVARNGVGHRIDTALVPQNAVPNV